jgi:hypothetical protein
MSRLIVRAKAVMWEMPTSSIPKLKFSNARTLGAQSPTKWRT